MESCCTLCPVGGRHLFFVVLQSFSTSDILSLVPPVDVTFTGSLCVSEVVSMIHTVLHNFNGSILSKKGAFSGVCVLNALLLSVSGEKVFESRPGMIHDLRTTLADLAGEGRAYMCWLAGEQTVQTVQKAFSQILDVVAESLAGSLTMLLQCVSHFLQGVGILQVGFPINKVTPEGLIFVSQWVLVTLIGYWLLYLAFRLVASTLRQALWLLKVSIALVCFGLILRDHSVNSETIAIRLTVLVSFCILLGVGTSGGSNAADKTARLEEQVKILERRLREMERWRGTEE
ncbi:voltage-gated monoatomic cation channel TMEM109 [Chaetodon auriga]|uniref:voltage-gated monoatomic cation channel TMEM109 n=1 Tax=Chaetodon auriga TaxID=39042 RepID=UPI004032EF00